MKKKALVMCAVLAAAVWLLAAGAALALDKFKADLKVSEANTVLRELLSGEDGEAPRFLLQRAKAVVVMPGMVKAGFVVGGKYGHGIISVRRADGSWSLPAFLTMAGGNIGLQIGAESVDLVLMVMNQRGLDGILKNQGQVSANAAVAAGPVGRSTEAGLTGASLKADVYSYSHSQGAFAGITIGLDGIEMDPKTDAIYYGRKIDFQELLKKGVPNPPESARKLVETLKKYGKK